MEPREPLGMGVVQVKICGLTQVEEAVACAELGADAIGFVFYPPSPRFVRDEEARAMDKALPERVHRVGVFVNEGLEPILRRVERCGLTAVQLHGQESPELVAELRARGLVVIKALFVKGSPGLVEVDRYTASAYLVECAGGPLPGGNALAWDWSMARNLSQTHPTVLAGGLSPETVAQAIAEARPHAVDVSSSVESSPGRKDIGAVRRFLEAVRRSEVLPLTQKVFS